MLGTGFMANEFEIVAIGVVYECRIVMFVVMNRHPWPVAFTPTGQIAMTKIIASGVARSASPLLVKT